MAKKPNKYTRLIRYMIQTIVNDKYQAPYIEKIIDGEWKEFFETVEKALQSVEEDVNMKYVVEITKRDVYIVEADAADEARELAINGCGELKVEDEIENIEVTNAEVRY